MFYLLLILLIVLIGVLGLVLVLFQRLRGSVSSEAGAVSPVAEEADGLAQPIQFLSGAQRAEFEGLFNLSRVPQLIHVNFVIQKVNSALQNIVGFSEEEMIGKPAFAFLAQESSTDVLYGQAGLNSGQAVQVRERLFILRCKSGQERLVLNFRPTNFDIWAPEAKLVTLVPLSNNEESTQALISVDQRLDLFSEDRLVHLIDQVMASERAARLATEHFSEGLMIIDSQGVLTFVNRHARQLIPELAERMTNQSQFEDLLTSLDDELDPEIQGADAAESLSDWFEHARHIGFGSVDVALAEDRWLRLNLSSIPEGLQVVTLVETTELRRVVMAAENAATSKSNFLASMSHEIRTPMNGIIGMVDLLRRTQLDDDQKEMLNTIKDSGHSLLALINDILDISKIEAGKIELEKTPSDPIGVVEQALAVVAPNAAKNQQLLIVQGDPTLPINLMIDNLRIRQILTNLVGNAIKFSPIRSEIVVRIDLLDQQPGRGAHVKFSVIDQGIGISQEAQEGLFEDFAQAEKSTSRIYGGTGLGLSICRRLVETMEGSIGVVSERGAGSEFYFDLWFEPAEDLPTSRPKIDMRVAGVAYVGSSNTTYDALNMMLSAHGVRTFMVKSTGELGETIKQLPGVELVVVLSNEFNESQSAAILKQVSAQFDQARFLTLTNDQRRRSRAMSDDHYVLSANPLYWQDVVAAVARLSRVDFEPAMLGLAEQEIPEIVPLSASEASTAGQLILVAEDNVINQQVIQRQINALGLACELANDGVQALDRYRKGGIALLLTDCDMPNMDGYELSRQIRQSEEGTGHRLPIIAITANAMQGAREACAEAGMDDYLVKPLEIPALQEMLGLHLKAKSASPTEAFAFADLEDVPTSALLQPETGNEETPSERLEIEAPAAASVLDLDEMRDLFGDDEMLQTILDEFVEVSRETVDLILQGVEWGDAEAVGRQAHKLKSSARTVGAHQLADICLVLEKAGKSDDMAVITEQAPALEPSFAAVIQAIEGMK